MIKTYKIPSEARDFLSFFLRTKLPLHSFSFASKQDKFGGSPTRINYRAGPPLYPLTQP